MNGSTLPFGIVIGTEDPLLDFLLNGICLVVTDMLSEVYEHT
jgi:hypothetical protein